MDRPPLSFSWNRRQALQVLAGTALGASATATQAAPSFDEALAALDARLGAQWRQWGTRHVQNTNQFHRAMDAWHASSSPGRASKEPREPERDRRRLIANEVLGFAKTWMKSATADQVARWRTTFPFSHAALIERHEHEVCSVDQCFSLPDDRCMVLLRNFRGSRHCMGLLQKEQWHFDGAVRRIGRSHDRQTWAFATARGIEIRRGWAAPTQTLFPYPEGTQCPSQTSLKAVAGRSQGPECLIPFNDGRRLIVGQSDGVYLMERAASGHCSVRKLHPRSNDASGQDITEFVALSMVHVALSPDERFIALGDQDSDHVVLDTNGVTLAELPAGNYPHHAVFDLQSQHVWLNECHLYNGRTVAMELAALTDTGAATTKTTLETRTMDDALRVYASAADAHGICLGGAGYMAYVNHAGQRQWLHHMGGSIKGLDWAPGGRSLWASSYSGMLERYEVRPGTIDPQRIGNSPLWDVSRWIFLADHTQPLRW